MFETEPETPIRTVVRTVGRNGDIATLAGWAAALPPDLVAVREIHVAELLADREDPGGAIVETRCDTECQAIVRPARGHGFADLTDPLADPLAPAIGLGAAIRTLRGPAIRVRGTGTRLVLQGLQIVAEDGPALTDDGEGACVALSGCLVESVSSEPAACVRGSDAICAASAVIQRGQGDGLLLADGAHAEGVTIFKPARILAEGTGMAVSGEPAASARSSIAFGFREAFGPGIGVAQGLVSDQVNALPAPDDFSHPSWTPRHITVDRGDTRPGPFAIALQRLSSTHEADARLTGAVLGLIAPRGRVGFSVIVAEPSAFASALALESPTGRAEMRVVWTATPPEVSLSSRRADFAAVSGGATDLGGGLYRLWLEAENRGPGALEVHPILHAAHGIENAGLSVGLHAGCAMAGPGHLGTGFCYRDAVPGQSALAGVDPARALRSVSPVLPDLRALEGGPLDAVGLLGGRDILGRVRLAPDTAGALSLNPAPRFLGIDVPISKRRGPRTAHKSLAGVVPGAAAAARPANAGR